MKRVPSLLTPVMGSQFTALPGQALGPPDDRDGSGVYEHDYGERPP